MRPPLRCQLLATATVLALCSGQGVALGAEHDANGSQAAPQNTPAAMPVEPGNPDATEFRQLRATLELGTVFLIGSAYYVTTSTPNANWDLDYHWDVFEAKVTGEAFGPDANRFGTNFIGHPLGGAGYYLAARSNHGSVLHSTAFAFFGSLLWELFGEINSDVSLNDSIVTPLAGVAIGESTFQLGSYFDRAQDSLAHRILGAVFGPFKTFNDAVDGVQLSRAAAGEIAREQHRFEIGASYAATREHDGPKATYSSLQLQLSERLAKVTPFDSPGIDAHWFHDGNASGMDLELGLGARGVDNLRLDARAVLVGYTFRRVQRTAHGTVGSGGLIGLGSGFHHGVHDYRRGAGGEKDRTSAVRPVDLSFWHRVKLGGLVLDSYVEAGPAFGGVRSFALDGLIEQPQRFADYALLPEVTRINGYYFGLGGAALASLALGWRGAQLQGRLQLQAYDAPETPGERLRVRMSDMERCSEQTLSWSPTGGATRLQLRAAQRWRVGSLNQLSYERTESSFGLGLGVVL